MTESFKLAPMSPFIRALTLGLLALPFIFFIVALFGQYILYLPAVILVGIYAWVWLGFRPVRFVLHPREIEVIWPLKRRHLASEDITSVRLMERKELKNEIGWGMRIGAGGLWGGFGWLWTSKRGLVQMYISRTDRFVWIERSDRRPWLITPERPETFTLLLNQTLRDA